jgi:hypothetical protein
MDMVEDDFYVDDESPEEVQAAWQRGEKGETTGSRDLYQRARSIVERSVAEMDEQGTVENIVLDALEWSDAESVESTSTGTVTKDEVPVHA